MSTKNALRKALVAATAAGALVILGGCAEGTHPGAAVVVGDREFSVSHIEDVATAVSTAIGQTFAPRDAISQLTRDEIIQQVAAKKGVQVTPADVAAAKKEYFDPASLSKLETSEVGRQFVEKIAAAAFAVAKLGGGTSVGDRNAMGAGSQVVLAEADSVKVVLSPRYGKWELAGGIDKWSSGSLSALSPQSKAIEDAAKDKERAEQQQPQG
ncbi:hypothetical protein [Kribbella deserti]|uniref:SurA-like protein n=1 Tax=Kribbella deserti TaxID=1926257 RepID=A0ABV6QT22_9ACTN